MIDWKNWSLILSRRIGIGIGDERTHRRRHIAIQKWIIRILHPSAQTIPHIRQNRLAGGIRGKVVCLVRIEYQIKKRFLG